MTKKKSNQPELIEDKDLDKASGGALAANLKINEEPTVQKAWPTKYQGPT